MHPVEVGHSPWAIGRDQLQRIGWMLESFRDDFRRSDRNLV